MRCLMTPASRHLINDRECPTEVALPKQGASLWSMLLGFCKCLTAAVSLVFAELGSSSLLCWQLKERLQRGRCCFEVPGKDAPVIMWWAPGVSVFSESVVAGPCAPPGSEKPVCRSGKQGHFCCFRCWSRAGGCCLWSVCTLPPGSLCSPAGVRIALFLSKKVIGQESG